LQLRSQYDRRILRYAIPALGALAAEPLYVLVDTAVVGHLGRSQLAALGLAATVLSVLGMFNFLQYGTTAQVARATGAGEHEIAARLGAQCLWLSLAFGCAVAVVVAALAAPVVDLFGAEGSTATYAVTYLRIAALGIPSAFLAIGGQGFLRGVSDLRTPLVIVIAGNVVNLVLELFLVYGLDLGIRGSAWGTVAAQTLMGAAMVVAILRRVHLANAGLRLDLARRLLSLGKFIFIRTVSLLASFVLAGMVVTRLGDAPLAAHQIAFQLWIFLALVLDAVAIAGQIIVGQELGAARPGAAFDASVRMIWLSIAVGAAFTIVLLALGGVIPQAFTSDSAVLAQCALLWPIFALMQPLNGIVFALDGILIGASDGRYLAISMAGSFVACASTLAVAWWAGWGVRGVWLALVVLIVVRLATLGVRFVRRQWLVTGFA
jgi:putative MATE family efflux protein